MREPKTMHMFTDMGSGCVLDAAGAGAVDGHFSSYEGGRAMDAQPASDGHWIEAVGMFSDLKEGNPASATRILASSHAPEEVMEYFMRMVSLYLRNADQDDVTRFVDAAWQMGPPPQIPDALRGFF
ncbi:MULTISPECIES: hypothetical protein [Corynebacterium]|uniref:hypothetical protein n=2 Tax=Corynebacteriaceae TaxID=1653 RepID=UPI00124BE6C7|nr:MULTISPECIES: hypothetical protein [Corynebacterium]